MKYRFLTNLFLSIAVIVCLVPAHAAGTQKNPISRERLFRAIEIGGLTDQEMCAIIQEQGVDFSLNGSDIEELKSRAISQTVLDAIKAGYRDPLAQQVATLGAGGPLSRADIVNLLGTGVKSELIETMLERRGVSFHTTPEDARAIEAAGGSRGLLGLLVLSTPKDEVKAPVKEEVKAEIKVDAPAPVTPIKPVEQTAPILAKAVPAQAPISADRAVVGAQLIQGSEIVKNSLARANNLSGRVVLDLVIDATGRVESAKRVSGHPILVGTAIDGVKKWRYKPATIDGLPAQSVAQVTIDFAN